MLSTSLVSRQGEVGSRNLVFAAVGDFDSCEVSLRRTNAGSVSIEVGQHGAYGVEGTKADLNLVFQLL